MARLAPSWLWIAGGALVVAAVVLALAGDGALDAVAFAAGGAGGILLTAAVFYAIGRSEERDRERHPLG